jgi:hypothetical protein
VSPYTFFFFAAFLAFFFVAIAISIKVNRNPRQTNAGYPTGKACLAESNSNRELDCGRENGEWRRRLFRFAGVKPTL